MNSKANQVYVQITPCDTYDIKINEITYPACTFESTWEGIAKFKTKAGDVLLVNWNEDIIDEFVYDLFHSRETKKCLVMKASPNILAKVMEKEE